MTYAGPPGRVLVTGAFGLVGSAVTRALVAGGFRVVATDLNLPGNRRAAAALVNDQVEVRWADLTVSDQVERLMNEVRPRAIIHLAAIIPPAAYRRPRLARAVNVDATATLLNSAASLSTPPRFVLASSVAVYGSRNPHRTESLLRPETPLRPRDLYGAHKSEAEALVRESALEWVILRLGGVLTSEPKLGIDKDTLRFEAALPTDGRIHTVDVRDVAAAFTTAVSTPSADEVFLIGGDASHRLRQSDIGSSIAAAAGLVNAFPVGKPGDPQSGENWFATDWMDTSRSERVLGFQHHSFPSMLDEIRTRARLSRYLAVAVSPLMRTYFQRLSPYRGDSSPFADPWRVIADRLGNPEPDRA